MTTNPTTANPLSAQEVLQELAGAEVTSVGERPKIDSKPSPFAKLVRWLVPALAAGAVIAGLGIAMNNGTFSPAPAAGQTTSTATVTTAIEVTPAAVEFAAGGEDQVDISRVDVDNVLSTLEKAATTPPAQAAAPASAPSAAPATAPAEAAPKEGSFFHQYADIIKTEADRTGVSERFLSKVIGIESGGNPQARSRTSSAAGPGQFISQTWLTMMAKHGEENGYGDLSRHISPVRGSDGATYYKVVLRGDFDPSARAAMRDQIEQKILDLRMDPTASIKMMAEFTKENKDHLEGALNRDVNDTELYMAHFLGAGGATKFLKAMQQNPNTPAYTLVSHAAAVANASVFFKLQKIDSAAPSGLQTVSLGSNTYANYGARSVGEVYKLYETKMEKWTPAANVVTERVQAKLIENMQAMMGAKAPVAAPKLSYQEQRDRYLAQIGGGSLEAQANAANALLHQKAVESKAGAKAPSPVIDSVTSRLQQQRAQRALDIENDGPAPRAPR